MITLRPEAIQHIDRSLKRRGKGIGIRVGIKTTGCSGLAYVLEYVDTPTTDDYAISVDQQSWSIYVDPKAIPYVQGMTIDFVRQGLQSGYQFLNPNERDRCGCGESFRV